MRLTVLVVLAGLALGQESPTAKPAPAPDGPVAAILEYTGKPLVVPFQCTDDDVQSAGLACSEEAPCPIYLDLEGVAAVGQRVFVGGNLHSAAVTLYSVLLGSEDRGHTWREVHDRIRAAGIDRIQFLDAETGWASGEKLSPLPQDPFLMLTTDGGKSWRLRPIFREAADNKLGAIQQFSFPARDSGSLIIDRGQGADGDRYELYETPDGGESWSFRQSSQKALTIRGAASLPTDLRLRADRRTRAFQIERRQGERWVGVAAFAVSIGNCKP